MELIKMVPVKFSENYGQQLPEEKVIMASEIYSVLKDAVQKRLDTCYHEILCANRMQKIVKIDEACGITYISGKNVLFFSFKAEEAMRTFIKTAPIERESLYEFLAKFDKLVLNQLIKAIAIDSPTPYELRKLVISMCLEIIAK